MHVSDRGMSKRAASYMVALLNCLERRNCMPIYKYILYAYTEFRECSTRTLSKGLRMDTLCINKVLT